MLALATLALALALAARQGIPNGIALPRLPIRRNCWRLDQSMMSSMTINQRRNTTGYTQKRITAITLDAMLNQ